MQAKILNFVHNDLFFNIQGLAIHEDRGVGKMGLVAHTDLLGRTSHDFKFLIFCKTFSDIYRDHINVSSF